jgi:hypothetical protein
VPERLSEKDHNTEAEAVEVEIRSAAQENFSIRERPAQ